MKVKESFKKEVDRMVKLKKFGNKNVLGLIGVSFNEIDDSWYLVLPFMSKGDLLRYIM